MPKIENIQILFYVYHWQKAVQNISNVKKYQIYSALYEKAYHKDLHWHWFQLIQMFCLKSFLVFLCLSVTSPLVYLLKTILPLFSNRQHLNATNACVGTGRLVPTLLSGLYRLELLFLDLHLRKKKKCTHIKLSAVLLQWHCS